MMYELFLFITTFVFWFYVDTIKFFPGVHLINSALYHSFMSSIYANTMMVMYPEMIMDYAHFKTIAPDYINNMLYVSFSYSFYDLYTSIQNRKIDEIIHASIFSSTFVYFYYNDCFNLLYVALLYESSSFLLNLRPFKKIWIDCAFVFIFFIYRFIIIPKVIYQYSSNPDNPLITFVQIQLVIMTSLNLYWFQIMMKKVIKILFPSTNNIPVD